jgi:hypothetical protein
LRAKVCRSVKPVHRAGWATSFIYNITFNIMQLILGLLTFKEVLVLSPSLFCTSFSLIYIIFMFWGSRSSLLLSFEKKNIMRSMKLYVFFLLRNYMYLAGQYTNTWCVKKKYKHALYMQEPARSYHLSTLRMKFLVTLTKKKTNGLQVARLTFFKWQN